MEIDSRDKQSMAAPSSRASIATPMEISIKAPSSISSNMDSEPIPMRKLEKFMRGNGLMIYGMAKGLTIFSMGKSKSRGLGKEQR